jgi:hemerythrin-like domain-containing protein
MTAQLPDPQNYSDPIRYLRDCHGIIEAQVKKLEELAANADEVGLGVCFLERPEWHDIIHFFSRIAYLHEQEEEQSLFPILKEKFAKIGFHTPRTTPSFLIKEHESINYRTAIIARTWREYLQTGKCTPDSEAVFLASARELIELYKRHISEENELIYKVAHDELLSPDERSEIMDIIRQTRSPQIITEAFDFEEPNFSLPEYDAIDDTSDEDEE